MLPKNIPEDLNVELLLSYLPEGNYKVFFKGLHKRNSYKDIVDIEEKHDGTLMLGIGRNSLYNSLPEFMFHPVDRFDDIPKSEEKERFVEEYQKQEQEKENAYKFFEPLDLLLLKLRVMVREKINEYVESNKVLIDIIGDQLTDKQKNNRFIKQALCFIPTCKNLRGDMTLLTFMLRKIFMEEGLRIEKHRDVVSYTDDTPKYSDGLDSTLGDGFVGNTFNEPTTTYDIHYWSDENCDKDFPVFLEEIETFRLFVQDYFLSIEEVLHFNIYQDGFPLKLSDDTTFNYLNFNTNI